MRIPGHLYHVAALAVLAACTDKPPPFAPLAVDVPAAAGATGPRVSGSSASGLVLSWMEESGSGASLVYSRWRDGQWSAPDVVVAERPLFVNWADMPSVQPMGEDRLAAHWLEKYAEFTYAYDVVFAQSLDGGANWSTPLRPHDDGTPTEHGFVSMFADGSGTGLIWLDGRKMDNEFTDDPVDTGMTLRAATIAADGALSDEQLVDELICDCCQTDVAVGDSGPVAVYRNRTPDEIRDIYISRLVDNQWQPGVPVADDHWEIAGCPVNGPAVVAVGPFVAVAWFTAAREEPTVRLAMSGDTGKTMRWQVDVAQGSAAGHVDLVLLPHNRVAVSWVQVGENGNNQLLVRAVGMGGLLGEPRVVADDVGRFSVPQLAAMGDQVIVVWTTSDDDGGRIRSAKVSAASL